MPGSAPNFSPYPFARLRRVSRAEAAIESLIARWIAARPNGARTAALVGGPVQVRVIGRAESGGSSAARGTHGDPYAAQAELRIAGRSIALAASSRPIRALAQRLLGGPDELDAPRPLALAEHAIWALVVAAALDDAGIPGEVWPVAEPDGAGAGGPGEPGEPRESIELAVELAGAAMTVIASWPAGLAVRVPPPRPAPAWAFELPVVVARCAIAAAAARALAVRDIVIVERELTLVIGDGGVGLAAAPGAIEAAVATGYVRRAMALPDDAHLELTVQLGTARVALRQLAELAVGQIVALGRPLAGPFEVRVAGRLIGQGELIDVDGELGVRIVSLVEE